MGTITAIGTALAEGCKLFVTLFAARNTPAMQANAQAATLAKIRASVDQHIASGNIQQVAADGSTQ